MKVLPRGHRHGHCSLCCCWISFSIQRAVSHQSDSKLWHGLHVKAYTHWIWCQMLKFSHKEEDMVWYLWKMPPWDVRDPYLRGEILIPGFLSEVEERNPTWGHWSSFWWRGERCTNSRVPGVPAQGKGRETTIGRAYETLSVGGEEEKPHAGLKEAILWRSERNTYSSSSGASWVISPPVKAERRSSRMMILSLVEIFFFVPSQSVFW